MLNSLDVDRAFRALGEPTRRAIVEKLSAGPSSVSALAAPFDTTLAAIVQHLRVLEESGIIRTEKVGRVRTCRIDLAGLNVAAKWIDERRALWERRFDRLGEVLGEDDDGGGQQALVARPPKTTSKKTNPRKKRRTS